MHHTLLQFPEIKLTRRDGHKLRGYFANTYGSESDLFHNHDANGANIYRYPQVQYKIINNVPTVLGLGEGGKLIVDKFLAIKELNIDGQRIPLQQKNLKSEDYEIKIDDGMYRYQFVNPWLPLNQKNYKAYGKLEPKKQKEKLHKILAGNMLSFFNSIPYYAEERIRVNIDMKAPFVTKFKNQPMMAFIGNFVCNVQLPNYIGLGKSVARGFGTIESMD